MQKKFKFGNFKKIFIFLYILVIYISPGLQISPKVNTFSLYLLFIVAIFTLFLNYKTLKFYPYLIWYLTFILISLISCLYAYNQVAAMESIYKLLVAFGIAFSMIQLVKNIDDIIGILKCFSFAGLLTFIVLLAKNNLITEQRLGNELYGNANSFAMLIMFSLMCALWLIIYSQKIMFLPYLLVILADFYMLALSGGRKFILIPILFFYIILLFKKSKFKESLIFRIFNNSIIIILVLLLVYYLMINIPVFYEKIGYRMEEFIGAILGNRPLNNSDQTRTILVEIGLTFFLNNPILGFGSNNFTVISGMGTYSHNNYVELLVNNGLIGFFVYYSFYGYLIYKLFSLSTFLNQYKSFFLGVLISLLIFEFGSVTYNLPIIQIFIVLSSLFLVNSQKIIKQEGK